MYLSPRYMEENKEAVRMLKSRANDYFTNDLIFNTVMGVMGIKAESVYEPENDLTSQDYDGNLGRFLTMYGTKKISDDPDLGN